MAGRYPVRNPDSSARVIDGEAVIVTPENAMLHTLDAVGTFLWSHADGRRSIDELAVALSQVYRVQPEQARQDIESFVAICVQRHVLRLRDAPLESADG